MAEECKDLVHDLVFNIFMRLPIKTIGLCACVCKSWLSVIKNHLFIDNHLLITTKNTTVIPDETRYSSMFSNYGHVFLLSYNGSGKGAAYKELRYRASSRDPKHLVGCGNGLVCILGNKVSRSYYHVLLWNPLMKKIKIIKKSQFKRPKQDLHKVVLGFGFVGDFKVVKLEYLKSNAGLPKVEVYSLRTDSWRSVTKVPHCKVIGNQGDQSPNSFVGGCAHWIADRGEKGMVILSFDMTTEEFREIELPALSVNSRPVRVTKFQDLLALFVDQGSVNGVRQVEVWVMKDHGVGDVWSMLRQLRPDSGVEYLEIFNNGVVLTIGGKKRQKSVTSAGAASGFEGSLALLKDGVDV